jgi:hypothetical protein
MTDLEKATAVVAKLQAKRAVHIQKGTELQDEQANVSLAAHTGDAKARKRLDEINTALALHASELQSLDAALRAAGERVAAAQRAEAEAAAVANVQAIKQVVAELAEHASVADDALHDLILAGDNLKSCLDRLHQLGVANPRHETLQVLGHNALLTALMRSPWKRYFEALAPSARRDFAGTVASWQAMIEPGLAQRLGEQSKQEAEHEAA